MVEIERLTAFKEEKSDSNPNKNNNSEEQNSNKPLSFSEKCKLIYNNIYTSKKGEKDRRITTRNRISFFLTVYSLMHAIDFFTLDNEEIYLESQAIRGLTYSFVITLFIVLFSLRGVISKAYLINFPIFIRCVWYLLFLVEKYIQSKLSGEEFGTIENNPDL